MSERQRQGGRAGIIGLGLLVATEEEEGRRRSEMSSGTIPTCKAASYIDNSSVLESLSLSHCTIIGPMMIVTEVAHRY